jgi:hypothetical protein
MNAQVQEVLKNACTGTGSCVAGIGLAVRVEAGSLGRDVHQLPKRRRICSVHDTE